MLGSSLRTTLNKSAHKEVKDIQRLYDIIDESLVAHIAIVEETGPVVIPMLAWRVDNYVYIHGANNSRLMRTLKQGQQTCLTFTLFDGWVLARSAFHHSAHYRSALVFGEFEQVTESESKNVLLNHFVEQIAPKRTLSVRHGSTKELAATMVLRMPLNEASVKVSDKPIADDLADLDRDCWAGYLPYTTQVGPLKTDQGVKDKELPDYSQAYGKRWYDAE